MFKISYDKKITMVQGDTGVIRMRISNYELSQEDEVRFAIVNKANPSILLCQHSDKKIVLEKQVTVFEKDGSARIVIYPYDTEYLQPGKYLYEIQVKTKDGRIDTVVPLTSFTLMDGSIQGEFGQTTPSKPEPTPSEIELRFKRLENEIIPELGNRITNVEKEIDGVNSSLDNMRYNVIYANEIADTNKDITQGLLKLNEKVDNYKLIIDCNTYTISKRVEITNPIQIDGITSNYITDTSGSVIKCLNHATLVLRGMNSGIKDLTISADKDDLTNGLEMMCGRPRLENVNVIKQGNYGIVIGSETEVANVNFFQLNNIKTKNCKHGILIAQPYDNLPDANAGTINGASISNCEIGLKLSNANTNTFIGLHIEDTQENLIVEKGVGNMFLNPHSESSATAKVKFGVDTERNVYWRPVDKYLQSNFIDDGSNNLIITSQTNVNPASHVMSHMGFRKLYIGTNNIGQWELTDEESNLAIRKVGTAASKYGIEVHNGYFNVNGESKASIFRNAEGGCRSNGRIYLSTNKSFGTIQANSEKLVTITKENDGYNYCHLNITNMPSGIGIMNTYVIDNNSIGVLVRNFTNEEKELGILNCKGYIEKLS